jgi:hypothetical protein
MPIDGSFNDAQTFVERFHRGAGVDAARRPLLKLFPEPLSMRAHILESFTVLQAQIAFDDQFFAATATSRDYL